MAEGRLLLSDVKQMIKEGTGGGYLGPGVKGIDQGGVPGSRYRDQGSNDYDDKYG